MKCARCKVRHNVQFVLTPTCSSSTWVNVASYHDCTGTITHSAPERNRLSRARSVQQIDDFRAVFVTTLSVVSISFLRSLHVQLVSLAVDIALNPCGSGMVGADWESIGSNILALYGQVFNKEAQHGWHCRGDWGQGGEVAK